MRLRAATKVGKKTKTAKKKQKKALENRVLTRQPSPPAPHRGEHPVISARPPIDVSGTQHTNRPPRTDFVLPSPLAGGFVLQSAPDLLPPCHVSRHVRKLQI